MIKKITLFTAIALLVVTISSLLSNSNFAFSYSNGSQGAGYSASPGDGNTSCATGGCHTSSSTVSGWISSNIPGTGYVPNTAYNITLTMTGGSHAFELTSEKSGGIKVGTFSSTSGVTLYNSNRSVVANTMFTTKTLTWTAPPAGNGPVTFYACFASGKSDAKKCTYTVSEYTIGIEETSVNSIFTVYPNPMKDKVDINYYVETNSNVEINLYSPDGKKVVVLLSSIKNNGSYCESFHLNNITEKGLYFIELKIAGKSTLKKIIIE